MILVLGMHRSGTSAITRGLQAINVDIGNDFPPAAEDNKKGFWEDRQFREINESLLNHFGMAWDNLSSPLRPDFLHPNIIPLRQRAVRFLRDKFAASPVIGLKDPRTSRLLPFWHEVIGHVGCQVAFVIVLRHPLGVSRSLASRNRFDTEKSQYLWLTHLIPAIADTDGYDRVVVSFERMIEDAPGQLARLANTLRLNTNPDPRHIDDFTRNFLDSGLLHAGCDRGEPIRDPAVPPEVAVAYRALTQLADDPGAIFTPACLELFRTLSERCEALRPIFALADRSHHRLDLSRQEIAQLQVGLRSLKESVASGHACANDTCQQLQYEQYKFARLVHQIRQFKDRMLARSASPKHLLVDGIFLFVRRVPGMRALATRMMPKRQQRKMMELAPESLFRVLDEIDSDYAVPGDLYPEPANPRKPPEGITRVNSNKFDVFCFANIEWAARYQRPQHMMTQYANAGHRVFYIVASRQPAEGEAYSIRIVHEQIYEVALKVDAAQDFYRHEISAENTVTMYSALQELIDDFRVKTAVLVVHLPYWHRLSSKIRGEYAWHVHYDCMDEWDGFPKIGREMLSNEKDLVRGADLVTVTSSTLFEKWAPLNSRCLLVRNGVDFEYFSRNAGPIRLPESITGPVVGYYGALAEWVDFKLIADVAKMNPELNFVLIGDVFVESMAGVEDLPNVYLFGRQPYDTMPKYLSSFDVCMIPFKLNKITHAVDPVKFYEFMSLGKPVVSVPMNEISIYGNHVYLAAGADDFSTRIRDALNETGAELYNNRVELARENTWQKRHEATLGALVAGYSQVSIIVVTYNNLELTRQCLFSIINDTTYPNYEIIIVDNHSGDGTQDFLNDFATGRPNVSLVFNNDNLGFAAANNQALRVASGDFLILLNNDTVVTAGWIDGLLRHLRDESIGLVGPVTNSIGNEAKIDVSYTDIGQMPDFAETYVSQRRGIAFDIGMLAMFCVAFRRDTFERVGYLDERFGIGMFEDDDYSKRVRQHGHRLVCAEDVFIHHYGQASFGKLIDNGEYDELWKKNQAYYESKWGPWEPHRKRRHPEQRGHLPDSDWTMNIART